MFSVPLLVIHGEELDYSYMFIKCLKTQRKHSREFACSIETGTKSPEDRTSLKDRGNFGTVAVAIKRQSIRTHTSICYMSYNRHLNGHKRRRYTRSLAKSKKEQNSLFVSFHNKIRFLSIFHGYVRFCYWKWQRFECANYPPPWLFSVCILSFF